MPKRVRPISAALIICALIFPFACVARHDDQNSASPKKSNQNRTNGPGGQRIVENFKVYERWLDQDVVYIITAEERAIFVQLTNDEERTQFMEQFWLRRDPTPDTVDNEFKEEHYRRIAYANNHFVSKVEGWKSDRGRVYIIWGNPDAVQSNRGCEETGQYLHPDEVRSSDCIPCEVWHYNFLEGVGANVELSFVDPLHTNEYKLTAAPAERKNLFDPVGYFELDHEAPREVLPCFDLIVKCFSARHPKFSDLNALVTANIKYNQLKFNYQAGFFRATGYTDIVPITIEIPDGELSFRDEKGKQIARVNLYGRITTIGGRVTETFENSISYVKGDAEPDSSGEPSLHFQRTIPLSPGLYRLDIAVKDAASGNVGITSAPLRVPLFETNDIEASKLVLADRFEEPPRKTSLAVQFFAETYRARPRIRSEFTTKEELVAAMQVYNLRIIAQQSTAAVSVACRINRGTQNGAEISRSFERFSNLSEQLTIRRVFPLSSLQAGSYKLTIDITDENSHTTISRSADFTVKYPQRE